MKNEAVTRRPIDSMNTDRVGYHASGTGLVMGFGAFKTRTSSDTQKHITKFSANTLGRDVANYKDFTMADAG